MVRRAQQLCPLPFKTTVFFFLNGYKAVAPFLLFCHLKTIGIGQQSSGAQPVAILKIMAIKPLASRATCIFTHFIANVVGFIWRVSVIKAEVHPQ